MSDVLIESNLISLDEVSELIGVHAKTIKNWILKFSIVPVEIKGEKYLTGEQLVLLFKKPKSLAGRKVKEKTGGPFEDIFEKLLKQTEELSLRVEKIEKDIHSKT